MIRRLLKVGRDCKGAVLIELSLAAPMLAVLVVGVTDISIAFGKKLQLEQAAQRAIEKVAQTTGEKTPEDTIKTEAKCQYNGTNAAGQCKDTPITESSVTVTYTLKCNGTAKDYSLDCAAGETEVRYIQAQVEDTYAPLFPIHFSGYQQADSTHPVAGYRLKATAGVRVG